MQNHSYDNVFYLCIGNCRNVRGLGKSKVVFRLFEKLRYSMKDQLNSSLHPEYKYLEEENGKLFNVTKNREFVWIG